MKLIISCRKQDILCVYNEKNQCKKDWTECEWQAILPGKSLYQNEQSEIKTIKESWIKKMWGWLRKF